ncbi:hypothetical protein QYE76_060000 [Lolium multiflorum]|uniref:Transposase (putative) gypsy type domain-containing protein n=1 Tax=Lolium multiflorum TaxID=4521 RepID=A0AAD8S0E4_LOLMU|nr:hypothetical protein QYE76_060000 [Lolium multiflorum]
MAAVDLGAAEWERSKISTQDVNMLKKLGISKKPKALCFPEESYPTPPMGYRVSFVDHLIRGLSAPIHPFLRGLLFVYGLQLHHLTPNSILHISIFITLCEAFLGIQPNWALWKRIFFCRRNGSPNVAYNIGGVVFVRPTVDYFDVKLPTQFKDGARSGCTFRRRTMDVRRTTSLLLMAPRKSFTAAHGTRRPPKKKGSTETLMARIHELQNTRGKELSGIQITAYFLRTRVQPLQARKHPLWKYAGDKDVDRLSVNLEVKDLERLVRKISSLSKKDAVPSSCRVTPFSAAHPLPENHPDLVSLPPLPEGGEVEERAVVTDDNQEAPSFVNEPMDSRKSAGSSEDTASAQSPPPAVSPKGKRKRNDVEDSDTSKAEEVDPSHQKAAYDPYLESLVSSDDEEEVPTVDVPMIKELIHIGSQFIGTVNMPQKKDCRSPYFFPKKEEPKTFLALAQSFNPSEDLGLKMRQENMKIAVESTVALVADSQQTVDWMKVGDAEQIEQSKWRSLIKAAKPNTKKILAYLGIKPSSTPSSSRPEV